jgi:hypothetical protein
MTEKTLTGLYYVCKGGSRISSYGGALKQIAPSGERRENLWGISCDKSRFSPKNHIFSNFRGGAGCAPPTPPWIRPWYVSNTTTVLWKAWIVYPSHSMQSSVDQCKSQSAYKYDLFCFRMGHIIGSDGLEIRRMYIYVINKDGHCAFQYLIHFFCFTRTDQNERKVH